VAEAHQQAAVGRRHEGENADFETNEGDDPCRFGVAQQVPDALDLGLLPPAEPDREEKNEAEP
jgi:hypothetical protein